MWLAILKSVLRFAVSVLPWEQITACLITMLLDRLQAKDPAQFQKVNRFAGKLADQLAVLAAATEDGKITVDEAKQLLGAWANAEATPRAIEDKVIQ